MSPEEGCMSASASFSFWRAVPHQRSQQVTDGGEWESGPVDVERGLNEEVKRRNASKEVRLNA